MCCSCGPAWAVSYVLSRIFWIDWQESNKSVRPWCDSWKTPLRRTAMPLEVLQSSPAITTCLLLKQTYYGCCLTCCHLVELASRLRLNKRLSPSALSIDGSPQQWLLLWPNVGTHFSRTLPRVAYCISTSFDRALHRDWRQQCRWGPIDLSLSTLNSCCCQTIGMWVCHPINSWGRARSGAQMSVLPRGRAKNRWRTWQELYGKS